MTKDPMTLLKNVLIYGYRTRWLKRVSLRARKCLRRFIKKISHFPWLLLTGALVKRWKKFPPSKKPKRKSRYKLIGKKLGIPERIIFRKKRLARRIRLHKIRLRRHLRRKSKRTPRNKKTLRKFGIKSFLGRSLVSRFLKGTDVVFIIKKGKNLFVKWFDYSGRLKISKSIMTLDDPKKQKTKKQKSFSVYFLFRKFAKTLKNDYKLRHVSLLLKGSVGIRRKKAYLSGLRHSGLIVSPIVDITNIPFNGSRLKKKKRK